LSRHVEFEGASWPLGVQFALDKWIQKGPPMSRSHAIQLL
jgi:hypothetical protein